MSTYRDTLEAVAQLYLQEHYDRDPTLFEVAHAVGRSEGLFRYKTRQEQAEATGGAVMYLADGALNPLHW